MYGRLLKRSGELNAFAVADDGAGLARGIALDGAGAALGSVCAASWS
jgi:hypothetical protein